LSLADAQANALRSDILRYLTQANRPASRLYAYLAQHYGEDSAATIKAEELMDHVQKHMIETAEELSGIATDFDA
jgi:hypothetical protein